MMPVIRISDSTFIDLKSISTWMGTKTPADTIKQLVQEKMDNLDLEPESSNELYELAECDDNILHFKETPGLTHTRVLSAKINNEKISKLNWGEVLLRTIEIIKNKGLSKEQLCAELQIGTEPYNYTDRGYKFYPKLGISIQGQSSPDAWKESKRLAEKYNITIEVTFQWRDKEGAQYRGKTGLIKVN